jgi:hypothetical protein
VTWIRIDFRNYVRSVRTMKWCTAIDKDGTIHIASTDGKLYAIGEKASSHNMISEED